MAQEPLSTPLNIDAVDGAVIVESDAEIAFTMTAHAALETADRLHAVALRAIGQEKYKEWKIGDPHGEA